LPVSVPARINGTFWPNVDRRLNIGNLRVAETEKYAQRHLLLHGGVEQHFPGKRRVMVQSPKVAHYDLKPRR